MGIATGTFQQLLQEHRQRPFLGRILTLGKQDIYLTEEDVRFWTRYYGVACAALPAPAVSPKPALAGRRFVTDRALFAFLGAEVESLDASDYEGCDHVADLNAPAAPPALQGRYDLVLDTGTFEHVFHLPNAFQFCHGLLKEGGRMIHMSPLSNYADHGFYMMSPTLYHDFYEANGWRLLQARIIRHTKNHDTEPYWVTDYSPEHFAALSYGGLGDGLYQSFFVVEKLPGATATVIPQQRAYRLHAWAASADGGRGQAAPATTLEESIATRARDCLSRDAKLIAALHAAQPDLRIAIYGAGTHTTVLLGVWRDLRLPTPSCIFQTTPPTTRDFEGLPLVGLTELQQGPAPHLIVLSSQRYESAMATTCERLFPSVPLLRLWT